MLVIVNTKTGTAILLNQYSWWLNFFLKAENTSKMAISTQLAESHCVSGVLCAVQLWEAAERHVFQPSLITIKWSQAYTLITTYTGSICARVYWGSLRHSGGNQDNSTLSNLQHLVTEPQNVTLLAHRMIEKWQNFNVVLEGVKVAGRRSYIYIYIYIYIHTMKRCIYTDFLMYIAIYRDPRETINHMLEWWFLCIVNRKQLEMILTCIKKKKYFVSIKLENIKMNKWMNK